MTTTFKYNLFSLSISGSRPESMFSVLRNLKVLQTCMFGDRNKGGDLQKKCCNNILIFWGLKSDLLFGSRHACLSNFQVSDDSLSGSYAAGGELGVS